MAHKNDVCGNKENHVILPTDEAVAFLHHLDFKTGICVIENNTKNQHAEKRETKVCSQHIKAR